MYAISIFGIGRSPTLKTRGTNSLPKNGREGFVESSITQPTADSWLVLKFGAVVHCGYVELAL